MSQQRLCKKARTDERTVRDIFMDRFPGSNPSTQLLAHVQRLADDNVRLRGTVYQHPQLVRQYESIVRTPSRVQNPMMDRSDAINPIVAYLQNGQVRGLSNTARSLRQNTTRQLRRRRQEHQRRPLDEFLQRMNPHDRRLPLFIHLAHTGNTQMMRLALRFLGRDGVHDGDPRTGETALHYAVLNGDIPAINLLLRNDADPIRQNTVGLRPVDIAIREDRFDILMLLLQSIKRRDPALFRKLVSRIFHVGIKNNNEALVASLISHVDLEDDENGTKMGTTAMTRLFYEQPRMLRSIYHAQYPRQHLPEDQIFNQFVHHVLYEERRPIHSIKDIHLSWIAFRRFRHFR